MRLFEPIARASSLINGVMHGFEYRDGNWMSIDVPGSSSATVNGINNQGWIVGFFVDANGNTVGLS